MLMCSYNQMPPSYQNYSYYNICAGVLPLHVPQYHEVCVNWDVSVVSAYIYILYIFEHNWLHWLHNIIGDICMLFIRS